MTRLLAAIGLAPARRSEKQSRRVEELSRAVQDWKQRATKATRHVARLEKEIRQHGRRLNEAQDNRKHERGVQKRDGAEWEAMQARLADAERALATAREQLAAMEVKLDILEGAANVLDVRTRTAVQRQAGARATV